MAASLVARTLARPSFECAFAAPAFVGAMLAFESALARAQAEEGVIDTGAGPAIAAACGRLRIDAQALVAEGKRSATLAVPLVRMLREEVARNSSEHAAQVHFGATSQDVLDTAMALCLKPCLEEADRVLEGTVRSLARRAREHRATPMLGSEGPFGVQLGMTPFNDVRFGLLGGSIVDANALLAPGARSSPIGIE